MITEGFYQAQILISAGGIFILALVTFSNGPKNRFFQVLSGFYLCVALWQADLYLIRTAASAADAELVSRLLRPALLFTPYFFLTFAVLFTKNKNVLFSRLRKGMLAVAAVAGAMNLAGIGVGGFEAKPGIGYVAKADIIYIALLISILAAVPAGMYLMIGRYLSADAGHAEKKQIEYFAIAIAAGTTGAATNLMNVYGLNVYPLGGFGVLVFFLITAYATLSEELLSLREAFRQIVVFSAMALIIGEIFFLVYHFIMPFLPDGLTKMALLLTVSFIIAVQFGTVLRFLEGLSKKAFMISGYDFQTMLGYVVDKIKGCETPEQLLSAAVFNVKKIFKAEKSFFFFRERESDPAYLYNELGKTEGFLLPPGHPVFRCFSKPWQVLSYKKLIDDFAYYSRPGEIYNGADIEPVIELMKEHGAERIFPLLAGGELKGIWLIGARKKRPLLNREEINWLRNLATQVSIMLENIIL
ncbi:MAG TPA: hypothetical protein ENN43_05670, partial [bacterium]|nr:hypothetical protein [bacterium]